MAKTMMNATPAKLRSGEWGAKVQGAVRVGDTITIVARSGKSWDARVARVLWSGDGVTLVATSASGAASGGARRRRGGCGCDCDECSRGCRCEPHCNCRGGNVYDC